MSEHPKLPDIVERIDSALGLLHPSIKFGGTMTDLNLLRACKAEIERLRSPAPAEDGEGLREALEEVKTFLTPALPYPERDRLYALVCAALSSGRDGGKT